MLTGDLNKELIELIQDVVNTHQERRKPVTNEVVAQYMKPRKLKLTASRTSMD